MRWVKKRKLKNKYCHERIGRKDFKRFLFRFLKEFGYYSTYVKEIKPYCKKFAGWDSVTNEPIIVDISFDEFLRHYPNNIYRGLFPNNNEHCNWDEIFYLWKEWARQEHYIGDLTRIV